MHAPTVAYSKLKFIFQRTHQFKGLKFPIKKNGFTPFQFREALYSSPQFCSASRMGRRLCPSSVREYSTLGGTSAYTFRFTRPLSSIDRSCAVSTFCDTFPTEFLSLHRCYSRRARRDVCLR